MNINHTPKFLTFFNVKYDDDWCSAHSSGYSSGKREGYEEAKKEYEEKLRIQEERLITSGLSQKNCDSISSSLYAGKNLNNYTISAQEDLTKLLAGDIPHQNNLPKASKLCGYIEIDGTYHKCNSCEHETIIRKIIWENEYFRKMYFETKASFFENVPRGMLQEEYFAMKILGFVKISSFRDTPNDMVVFWYNPLTYKQAEIVYPR